MVILKADGSVVPIITSGGIPSLNYAANPCAGDNETLTAEQTPVSDPNIAASYYLDDHLGTTQMELSSGGWPVWSGAFTPFGQEIINGTATNYIGAQPADGTAMRYKFTGKERDTESGLDYFGARYYGSSMGRFSSPDDGADAVMGVPVPFADLNNPQSLNLYSYVLNNPLSRRDYDGHASYQPCNGGTQQCFQGDYDGEVYCKTSSGCIQWNAKTGEWGQYIQHFAPDGIKPDYSILEWIVGGKVAEAGLGVIGGLAGRVLAPAAEGAAGKGVQAVAKVLLKAGTKQEAKAVIDGMADGAQKASAKRGVASLGNNYSVTVTQGADGSVSIAGTRPGFDGSMTMTKTIDAAGNSTTTQTANDAAGNLVHYDPKH